MNITLKQNKHKYKHEINFFFSLNLTNICYLYSNRSIGKYGHCNVKF